MELADAAPFLADHHQAVIATLGEDDVPHLTNVVYAFDGRVLRVSLTDERVKVENMRRRPVATLSVSDASFWHYVTAECDVELSATTTSPGDDVGRELLDLYTAISGEHDDPEEFLQAMVDQRRLVLRATPRRVYGQLG